MSAASCGSFCSLRLRPRAAKFSRQRIPHRSSCSPVATVSRPQPKRRSAWRALPPQSSVATSARNNRRWYPVRRLAPDRIKASRRSTESSMGMAQPDDETVIAQLEVSHHWTGQDSPVRGRFPLTGRLSDHASKRDRAVLSSATDLGYELLTALVLSDRDGAPIAPVCQQVRSARGVHSSRSARVQPVPSQLDALAPTMRFVQRLKLGKPTVHIIDREADSVAHYRQWSRHQRRFVVRADAQRVVRHEGQERSLSEVVACLHRSGVFRRSRTVLYHGRRAEQFVAEVAVVLERPAAPNRREAGGGPRRLVRGVALPLRLVVSELRDADGSVLATGLLLTNVPATVSASEVALWYYWRWRVESYFKLLKGAGMHLERWQQETAPALAKRLLVAGMACVVVWQVARSEAPEAAEVRRLLVRLSGRQMKWGVESTEPALLAGLWVLLWMTRMLEHEDLSSLLRLAQSVLPTSEPPGEPQRGAV